MGDWRGYERASGQKQRTPGIQRASSARTVAVFPAPEAPVTTSMQPTDTLRVSIELAPRRLTPELTCRRYWRWKRTNVKTSVFPLAISHASTR